MAKKQVIHISDDAHAAAKAFCAKHGLAMSTFVGKLINDGVKANGKPSTIPEQQRAATEAEGKLIRDTLEANDWRLIKSARALDLQPATLRKMIVRHGLGDDYEIKGHCQGRPAKE
jgi:transcriptional regulator with GAF, ATPase, and Fis domain